MAVISYGAIRSALKRGESLLFYSSSSLQLKLIQNTFFVFPQNFYKGRTMNRHIKSISLGALTALAMVSASAQTPAPAAGASAPATLGVTPREAAAANQQAVPRSDTATVVRTAPSPAARASNAMSGNTGNTGSTAGNSTMGSTRSARADRN